MHWIILVCSVRKAASYVRDNTESKSYKQYKEADIPLQTSGHSGCVSPFEEEKKTQQTRNTCRLASIRCQLLSYCCCEAELLINIIRHNNAFCTCEKGEIKRKHNTRSATTHSAPQSFFGKEPAASIRRVAFGRYLVDWRYIHCCSQRRVLRVQKYAWRSTEKIDRLRDRNAVKSYVQPSGKYIINWGRLVIRHG